MTPIQAVTNELDHVSSEINRFLGERDAIGKRKQAFRVGEGVPYSTYKSLCTSLEANSEHLSRLQRRKIELEEVLNHLGVSPPEAQSKKRVLVQADPPKAAEWIISILAPEALRNAILGDCQERFEEDFRVRGRSYARRAYAKQALQMIVPYVLKGISWLISTILKAYISSKF